MQISSKFCHNKHLTHSSFAPVTPSRVSLPITMYNALLFNSATFITKKQVVIHKKILL